MASQASSLHPRLVQPARPFPSVAEMLAATVILISSAVDLPSSLRDSGVSVQGVLTVIYFLISLLSLIGVPAVRHLLEGKNVPFVLFFLWGSTSLIWTPAFMSGIQNLLVIGTFLIVAVTAEAVTRTEPRFAIAVDKWTSVGVLSGSLAYAASMILYGPGTSELIGARAFSLFVLFGVAQQLARWRSGKRSGLVGALVLTALIIMSHSRMAFGIAVVLFPLSQLPVRRPSKLIKMALVAVIMLAAAYFSVMQYDALRDRFFKGDVSLSIGAITINGSGRTAFWRTAVNSFMEAPITGKGAGAAQDLIESIYTSISHPHNDYVRVAHDYGLIGVCLWLATMGTWLVYLFRAWLWCERMGSKIGATLQLSALLAFVSFLMQMTAENTLIYLFITAPLALIVGSAAGSYQRLREVDRRRIHSTEQSHAF